MVPKVSLRFSPKFLPIAWILVGLMVGGSLFDYLASQHTTGVCVELRILEQEDDRSDFSDMLFVPIHGSYCLSLLGISVELVESPRLHIWTVRQAAHLKRGPPVLALVTA